MAVQLNDVIFVAVFVTIASLATAYFLAEQGEVRGVTDLPLGYNATFDLTSNVTDSTEQVRESLSNTPVSLTTAVSLFGAGYSIMRLTFNLIFLPVDVTYAILEALQAPEWTYALLTVLWVLAVAYAIILIVFGRSPIG